MVEGPLNNLQPSMIQFSKPKKSLIKSIDQFKRHETNARDYLAPAPSNVIMDRKYIHESDPGMKLNL